jgi:putative peptidoglycan lipid II flippase
MTVDPVLETAIAAPELEPIIVETEEQVSRGLARATTILAIGNVASRVMGFAKEILLSNYFGASRLVDAFQIAITVPQDLYDLAISGHVNSALVPVLSEYAVKDRRELWRLANALLSLVCVGAGTLVILIEILAPQIITLYRGADPALNPFNKALQMFAPQFASLPMPGLSAEAFALSVHLLRLTAPALFFLSLFAVVSGLLYALKQFALPAFAAALFNGTVVITMIVLAPVIGIERAALGTVLGAFFQLALQFAGLRGARLRFQLRGLFTHPGVKRVGILYIPVMISLVLDVLVNRPFSYNIASQAKDGSIAYMNWATSLREFPMGLVGTAISIAILPTLARQALNAADRQAFRDTLGKGVRLALSLIIPATVGMFVLAGPLIGLVFERGAFTASNTFEMSHVLRLYLLGIPFAAVDLILVFAFYAMKNTLTPAVVGIFSLICYIAITMYLQPRIGYFSLMVADSLKHFIHMTISLILLHRYLRGLHSLRLPRTIVRVGLATVVMALVTYAVSKSVIELWPIEGLQQRALLVLLPSSLGAVTYFVLASLLKLDEFNWFVQAIRQKFRRKR